ncbi:MAG: nitrile hydratase subunit beta [Pseudomonadota bacterium]
MNGIHDMGGMDGFGSIDVDKDEPLFHAEWEKRVFAMQIGAKVGGSIRGAIERMAPDAYLRSSYYEKWLHARVETLVDAGAISREELAERERLLVAAPQSVSANSAPDPDHYTKVMNRTRFEPSPDKRATIEPHFRIGDRVTVRNMHPVGHTRLPQYVRGKVGTVERFYGTHYLQDDLDAGVERPIEPVYAVRFDGDEIWGSQAEPNSAVVLDMWESYLEPT